MRVKYLILPVLALLSACGHSALQRELAATRTKCGVINTSPPCRYCYTPGKGKAGESVIYYFHGSGASETKWVDPDNYTAAIRKIWVSHGVDYPAVISVSFGKMWLLTDKSAAPNSGLYEIFTGTVVPYLESAVLRSAPGERVILGESMGGFNAGVFGLRNYSRFARIALVCPLLGIGGEYGGESVESYMAWSGANRSNAEQLYGQRKVFFPTLKDASAQSPAGLMDRMPAASGPAPMLYVSCGDKDEFGFLKTAESFAAKARGKMFWTDWRPVTGGRHCAVNVETLSGFLTE